MADAGYDLIDEPRAGPLEKIAVSPTWTIWAAMSAGIWFAWPWFLINGRALGSPTWREELRTAAIGLVGVVALASLLTLLVDLELLRSPLAIRLSVLTIVVWKLGVSYWLFMLQSRTFHLRKFYGGTVESGLYALMVGVFLRPVVLDLVDSSLWKIIVSGVSAETRGLLGLFSGGLWP